MTNTHDVTGSIIKTVRSSFFKKSLPYCFQKMDVPGDRHVWLPVNRYYKPLGVLGGSWADYEKHIDSALVFARAQVFRCLVSGWPSQRRPRAGLLSLLR